MPRWAAPAAAVALVGLALSGVATRKRSEAAERRYPPLGRMLDINGVAVHVLEAGEGRPLVLIHGNGAMVEDRVASGLFDKLAKSYRVIAFDRPGCGHSERPKGRDWSPEAQAALLIAACEQLDVKRPLVLGHSFGTLVAVAWAIGRPDACSALILMSGYYYPTSRLDALAGGLPALPGVGDAYRHTLAPFVGKAMAPLMYRKIFAPQEVSPDFKRGYPEDLAMRPLQLRATSGDSTSMVLAATRLAPRYETLRLPVAVIAGDGDDLVDFDKQSARLAGELVHSWLIKAPGAGHMMHYQAHDRILAAVELAAAAAPEA